MAAHPVQALREAVNTVGIDPRAYQLSSAKITSVQGPGKRGDDSTYSDNAIILTPLEAHILHRPYQDFIAYQTAHQVSIYVARNPSKNLLKDYQTYCLLRKVNFSIPTVL